MLFGQLRNPGIPGDSEGPEEFFVALCTCPKYIFASWKPLHLSRCPAFPTRLHVRPAKTHTRRLIRVFAVRLKTLWILGLRRLWSDCSDTQVDLCLRWTRIQYSRKCCVPAQLWIIYKGVPTRDKRQGVDSDYFADSIYTTVLAPSFGKTLSFFAGRVILNVKKKKKHFYSQYLSRNHCFSVSVLFCFSNICCTIIFTAKTGPSRCNAVYVVS